MEDPERGTTMSYGELETLSNAVSEALTRHGVRPGDRVAIVAPKSVSVVTAIFGILTSRAAYVPVDSGAPQSRNATILEDCSVRAAVVAKSLLDGLSATMVSRIFEPISEVGDDLILVGTLGKTWVTYESDGRGAL